MPGCTPTSGGMTSSSPGFSVGRFGRAGPAPLIWAPPALVRLVWRHRSPFEGDLRNTCTASRELGSSFPDGRCGDPLPLQMESKRVSRIRMSGSGGPLRRWRQGSAPSRSKGTENRQTAGGRETERRQGSSHHGPRGQSARTQALRSWPG